MGKLGFKHTEETKRKISENNARLSGDKHPQFGKRGEDSHNFGRKHSEEHKKKNSVAHKGCKNPWFGKRGEDTPRWNTNLEDADRKDRRHYPEYTTWRKAVYERDNFTCQKCGKTGGRLNAHHVEDYATNKGLRTTVSNGITFCVVCHKDFHHIYGNKSNINKIEKFILGNNK